MKSEKVNVLVALCDPIYYTPPGSSVHILKYFICISKILYTHTHTHIYMYIYICVYIYIYSSSRVIHNTLP